MAEAIHSTKTGPCGAVPARLLPLACLLGVTLLSFGLRLAWIGNMDPRLYPSTVGSGNEHHIGWDGVKYDDIAQNLLNKAGYGYTANQPDAWRPPGYPFFLYATYRIFGHNYGAVRWLQALLGALTSFLLCLLTERLTRSTLAAALAGLLHALDYHSIMFTSILYTEVLTAFFCLLAVYMLYLTRNLRGRQFLFVLVGACLSLWYAVLCRPGTILFWGWVGLWMIIKDRKQPRRVITSFAAVLLSFCVIILPWTLRNYRIYNRFVLISTNGGLNFFMVHHPRWLGDPIPEQARDTPDQQALIERAGRAGPLEVGKLQYRFGFDFIRKQPMAALELALAKQKLLWTRPETDAWGRSSFSAVPIPLPTFPLIALLGAVGVLIHWRHIGRYSLVLGFVVVYAATLSLVYYYHGPRTRLMMVPFVAIIAAAGLARIIQYAGALAKRTRQRSVTA